MAAERTSIDFGRKLREARERRGISIRQIASATKISVSVLEALERNDISRLPGGIFSRAFVRSYAVEVGLDPDATIQDFIQQFPHGAVTAGHPGSDPVDDPEAIDRERRTASAVLRLIVLSVAVVALAVYVTGAGAWLWRRLPVRAAADAGTAPADRSEAAGTDAGQPGALRADAPQPPLAATAGSAPSRPSEAQSPTPSPAADSGPAIDRRPSTSAPVEAPAPTEERLTIGLGVTRPCWVSATVDGHKRIERLLQPGDAETIDVRRELVLTAGDAAAIAMTLNGAEAKPLGKAGEVVTRRVNLANFKDYVQSR